MHLIMDLSIIRISCLFVQINLVSSVDSSLFSWGKESLVLSRYYNSSLTILYDYLELLPVYSITKMVISQLSFGRVFARYLVSRFLIFSLLSID